MAGTCSGSDWSAQLRGLPSGNAWFRPVESAFAVVGRAPLCCYPAATLLLPCRAVAVATFEAIGSPNNHHASAWPLST